MCIALIIHEILGLFNFLSFEVYNSRDLFSKFRSIQNSKLIKNEKYSYKMKGVQKDMINIVIGMIVFLLFILIIAALLRSLAKV